MSRRKYGSALAMTGGEQLKLTGNCILCGKHLGLDAYNRQEACGVIDPEGQPVVWCASHMIGGRHNPRWEELTKKIALALVAKAQGKQ